MKMKTTSLVPLFCGIFVSFVTVEAGSDICFGCRDTTDTEGQNDCQTGMGEMNDLHQIYKADYGNNTEEFLKHYGENPLVQDCRPYANLGFKYCCVEELERLGTIQSYIRGCCDGKNFSVSTADVPRLKYAYPNNQSLCGYYENKGVVVCVQLCEGTFCNGPSFAQSIHLYSIGILILSHFIWRVFVS